MHHITTAAVHLTNSGPLAGNPGEILFGIALFALLVIFLSNLLSGLFD
jgi:hypothetical protein